MKKALIFILLTGFTLSAFGQNTTIDSLKILIDKTKSPEERIDLKNKMATEFTQVNMDSAIAIGNRIRDEARNISYENGEFDALRGISSNLIRMGRFDQAKIKLKEAQKILQHLNDTTQIGKVYGLYGMLYGMQSQYDSSRFYYEKAITNSLKTGNKKDLPSFYGGIAISYQMQSNFTKTLFYQQKSLEIAEELNNIRSQAVTSLNMASTYQLINDTIRAEAQFLNAIRLAKKKGLTDVEVYGYSNLASLYSYLEKWDKVYDYSIKAAKLANEWGDIPIEVASYSKAVIALANLKRFSEAEKILDEIKTNSEAAKQPIILGQINEAIAITRMLQKNYSEAAIYFEKNIKGKKEIGNIDRNLAVTYKNLSFCYENLGNYKNALLNFQQYATIKDSINSSEKIKELTEQTMNYEFQKKEELRQLDQKNTDEINRTRQLALLIGLGLTLILMFVAYRALRIKQKGNAKLKIQKKNLQKALMDLQRTQAQLVQSEKMASLGELTAGIAHEIQNPLNFVNNFSEVSTELVTEMTEELENHHYEEVQELAKDIKMNLEKINHHGKRADAIVKGMLQHSRKSNSEKKPTDINALCEEYLKLSYHGLRAKDNTFNATLKTDLGENIQKINLNPQNVGRVILNLLNNAFYALNEKKKIAGPEYEPILFLQTINRDKFITITIKDNGIGIPDKVMSKIFQPFFTTKPSGQGTGLGLSISHDIITNGHNGGLTAETVEGEGTTFTITLPK